MSRKQYIGHHMNIEPLGGSLTTARTTYRVVCSDCDWAMMTNAPTKAIDRHLRTCMVCGHVAVDNVYGYAPHKCVTVEEVTSAPALSEAHKLVYVDNHCAWFCDQPEKAWGDDWNDAPYECNAGNPYTDRADYLRLFWRDGFFETPAWRNHSVSVQDVNRGACPWLDNGEVSIPAHTNMVEFARLVTGAGGEVYARAEVKS
jgi:hypothetical protein